MKQEEEEILIEKKEHEGKSRSEIHEELELLKLSQIKFKSQDKELKKSIILMNRIMKENSKLKNKLAILQLKLATITKPTKESEKENATIKNLERVILVLKSERRAMGKTELGDFCILKLDKVKPCLVFLEKNKLIKSMLEGGMVKYII